LPGRDPAVAKVHVVTTLTRSVALVREIGGDRIEVYTLAKGNEDPHVLPAKTEPQPAQ